MVRMNRVMLVGNLTRDPEIRKTAKGLAVAELGLAVNEGYGGKNGQSEESTCFVDVIAWDKQAETCGEYLRKGSQIFVEGRLQYSQWQDKDGHSRNKIRVSADRVQFMGRPEGSGSSGGGNGNRDCDRSRTSRRRDGDRDERDRHDD
ncbi:MAG: single-stranded DNA-binding protein [Verrucomicrobia bacterium]|nr:single-stranded DNA-binding protein [Kiritimatiellia bacterium]MCO6400789.1 single-stranded DNA-binding protein [Verrucomicrobiota bacterium]